MNDDKNESIDPVTKFIGTAVAYIIVIIPILLVVSFFVAQNTDAVVSVVEVDDSDKGIRLIQKGVYMKEDYLLGLPAFVYSIYSVQPNRYYQLTNGDKIDLSDFDNNTSVIINRSSHTLYNDLWVYGDWADDKDPTKWKYNVKHLDNFKVKPRSSYMPGIGYGVIHVGCSDKPPQTSALPYVQWLTSVENPNNNCK